MKKTLVALLAAVLLLSAVGCEKTPPEVPDNTENNNDNYSENTSVVDQLLSYDNYDVFEDEIYLCDDVYRSDDTPTHGTASIGLPMAQDVLELKDYDILLCGDGCSPDSVVSRASQGYAPVYRVVSDGEIDGNFKTLKFKMEIPEGMLEDVKKQGVYEQIVEEIESQYYYLIVLDEKHYAYIHLERKDGAEKIEDEAELADGIVKNARINFEPKNEKFDLNIERVIRLAENKGEALTWDDFQMYNARETGSGLYILVYDIDEDFELLIGGVPTSSPMYIRLVTKADRDNYIEIRTDDVEKFIFDNIEEESQSKSTMTVYSKVTEISELPQIKENAIVTGKTVGGFVEFYSFTPGLKYYRYDAGAEKYYECEVYLPNTYENGEIIHIRSGAGSGEIEIIMKAADENGKTIYPAYLFAAPNDPLNSQPSSRAIYGEQELIDNGISTDLVCGYPLSLQTAASESENSGDLTFEKLMGLARNELTSITIRSSDGIEHSTTDETIIFAVYDAVNADDYFQYWKNGSGGGWSYEIVFVDDNNQNYKYRLGSGITTKDGFFMLTDETTLKSVVEEAYKLIATK